MTALGRALRSVLLGLAGTIAVFAALTGWSLSQYAGGFLTERSFLCAVAGTILCLWAAFRWKVSGQFRLVLFASIVLAAELVCNAAAWLNLLPVVNTKIKCAYGRVYWTSEGHGNSIRNRHGWHAPAFRRTAVRRIAIIGDSMVEAVEVPRSATLGALLDAKLQAKGKDAAVFSFGTHGTSVAHHREVIEYVARQWQPQEIILMVFLGNDLSDTTPETCGLPPQRYLYYDFAGDGRLTLNPASEPGRRDFTAALDFCHRSLLLQASTILRSHSMLVQSANSVRSRLALRKEQAQRIALAGDAVRDAAALGLNPTPFADPETPQARRCLDLLIAQLDLCAAACAAHRMELRLVIIPAFPADFYRTQHGTDWSMKIAGFDYLRPERAITAVAASRGWPCLALAEQMRRDRLTVAQIQRFYWFDGTGHFTEEGHAYAAEKIAHTFFSYGGS